MHWRRYRGGESEGLKTHFYSYILSLPLITTTISLKVFLGTLSPPLSAQPTNVNHSYTIVLQDYCRYCTDRSLLVIGISSLLHLSYPQVCHRTSSADHISP